MKTEQGIRRSQWFVPVGGLIFLAIAATLMSLGFLNVKPAIAAAADCAPARPHSSGFSTEQYNSRDYILYVPSSYTGSDAVPLVFNLHGLGSSPSQQMLLTSMSPSGFIVVAREAHGT